MATVSTFQSEFLSVLANSAKIVGLSGAIVCSSALVLPANAQTNDTKDGVGIVLQRTLNVVPRSNPAQTSNQTKLAAKDDTSSNKANPKTAVKKATRNETNGKVVLIKAGNRNTKQPSVPGASKRRTRATKSSFDKKYEKVLALLKGDKKLQDQIRKAAKAYDIAPIHIAGALVGEHTYNVDVLDRLQVYYIKAVSYSREEFTFDHDGERVQTFLRRDQFETCKELTSSLSLWTCRENVWNAEFRGKTVDGKDWPNNRFSAVFFQPFLAGQTFGLGQVNPLTALKVSDLVRKTSRIRKISEKQPAELYRAIMKPDTSLAYVAAIVKTAIDDYRNIAGFDISENPGLTATLYNLGNSRTRAGQLAAINKKRIASRKKPKLPEENYYGWLVNDRIEDLKEIF